jgi:hypothetical protein
MESDWWISNYWEQGALPLRSWDTWHISFLISFVRSVLRIMVKDVFCCWDEVSPDSFSRKQYKQTRRFFNPQARSRRSTCLFSAWNFDISSDLNSQTKSLFVQEPELSLCLYVLLLVASLLFCIAHHTHTHTHTHTHPCSMPEMMGRDPWSYVPRSRQRGRHIPTGHSISFHIHASVLCGTYTSKVSLNSKWELRMGGQMVSIAFKIQPQFFNCFLQDLYFNRWHWPIYSIPKHKLYI